MSENKQIFTKIKDFKSLFNNQLIVRNIPFFLFLAGLAILYIYNGHYSDKLVKRIAVSEKAIKEMEYEYKSVQSDVIFRSKASELIRAVEPLGLKELNEKATLLVETKN